MFSADLSCDFQVARIECGHEVSIDKQRWHEVGLSPFRLEIPERIEDLDVSVRVSTQVVLLDECGESLAGVLWMYVDSAGRWFEIVS
ncbi:MAG: hypothetical protein HW376_901 [candidate division NC10 bacterium]|nr:hypothetical protein [candidate division NC10 bacterium]